MAGKSPMQELREGQGKTRGQWALALGVSENLVRMVETGSTGLSGRLVDRLGELGMSAERVLDLTVRQEGWREELAAAERSSVDLRGVG